MPKAVVNYTKEQVSKMVQDYQAANDSAEDRKAVVAAIAKELGKTVKSVIAKLCREEVYVKAVAVTKTGAKITRKEDVVIAIASALSIDFDAIKSLGKATKADLQTLVDEIESAQDAAWFEVELE